METGSARPAQIVHALRDEFRPHRPPSRLLYRGAAVWFVSAVVHLGMLVASGMEWSGAVSYRKPFTFAASFTVLLVTFGWILDQLPDRRRLASGLAWTMLVSSSLELSLITIQAWRGTASHFNDATATDSAVFGAMGATVAVISACLIVLLVWFLRRPAYDHLVHRAVASGLWLMMVGLGLGQWIIQLGNTYVAEHHAVPGTVTYGGAGVAKLPHAVALHGIQVFIVAAVLLHRSRWSATARRNALTAVVGLYSVLLAAVMGETVSGRSPLEPSVWNLAVLVSAAGIVVAFAGIARAVRPEAAPAGIGDPVLVG